MFSLKKKNIIVLYYLPYMIFFLATFLFFGFLADYLCFYQEKSSLFIFSNDFFSDNLEQPGSLLIYFGKFLSTFFFYPLAGAVIYFLIISLIVYLVSRILSDLSGERAIFIPLLLGAAVFSLQTNYQYLLYNNLGLLFQLFFFYLTIRNLNGWVAILIFPLLYFVTGGFAWIFFLIFTLYLALKSFKLEGIKIFSFLSLNLLMVYIFKEYVFFQSLKTLLIYPISDSDTGRQFKFLFPVIGLLVLLPLIAKIKIRSSFHIKMPKFLNKLIPLLILIILLVASATFKFEIKNKQYFHVEKLFYQNKRTELVDFCKTNPTNNILTIYLVNIVLCETGKLNDQLFWFPQSPDGRTLFLKWEMTSEVSRKGAYFYYTTGMINEAHRWAYENMVMLGHLPENLKILIKTELINGNYMMASKYISILKKTIFYRKDAREYENLLFNDKAIDSHPELGTIRKNKIANDFFTVTDNPYFNIEKALASNSLNRKAFEYKIAYLLLKKDYRGVVYHLPELERLGFNKIPIHLQEAAAVFKLGLLNSGPIPDLGNLNLDPRIELRLSQFLKTFQSYKNDLKSA